MWDSTQYNNNHQYSNPGTTVVYSINKNYDNQLLLLLLRIGRGVFLKSSIRDLQASKSAESNVQDSHEEERRNESHENAYT